MEDTFFFVYCVNLGRSVGSLLRARLSFVCLTRVFFLFSKVYIQHGLKRQQAVVPSFTCDFVFHSFFVDYCK